MKKIILIFLLLPGCGSKQFMDWLASEGDAFTEGVELGKKQKALMFECDFDDECFFRRVETLLERECQEPEKFNMVTPQECFAVFRNQVEELYYYNKAYMGYS